jgi:hypothetical protein
MGVESRKSQNQITAWMSSPSPRFTCPSSTRSPVRRPRNVCISATALRRFACTS